MRIQYVLHADFEKPGAIDYWAVRHKAQTKTARPFAGDKLPSPDDFDLLILMGGPQSPLKMDIFPYLNDEISLIKKAHEKNKIILGFCLGAQLIGEALGGKTENSPHKEVGMFPVQLTKEGKQDPILGFLPEKFDVMHWHNDMPGVPAGATILGFSEGCPRQIIRFGDKIYGFQCHPEVTVKNIKMMVENCPEDLMITRFTQPVGYLLEINTIYMNGIIHKFLDNLIKQHPIKG